MADREHPRFFYRSPSEVEVERDGPIFAREKAIARANKINSRIFRASMALATGTLITLAELVVSGSVEATTTLSAYVTPILVNGISQLRTERVQRRSIARIGAIAVEARIDFDELAADNVRLQAHRSRLEQIIGEAGLEPPDSDSGGDDL